MTIENWIERYRQAWIEKDATAATSLFTEDAVYRERPFAEPYIGRGQIRAYWRHITATQDDLQVTFGEPIVAVDHRQAAVHYLATMSQGGTGVQLSGILILRFDMGGLCDELREFWHDAPWSRGNPARD